MPSPSRIIIDSLISPIAAIESSGYGFSSGVANRPAPRDRLTSTANDGRTSVNRFGPFNRAPAAPTPTTKPATSSVSSKRKTLADFTAEAKKKAKPIGSVVQSPDQQYKTGQMGKQPIKVYP